MSFDWNYFYKGAISGATGLLCSHPIDTIKTNIQNGTKIHWNLRSLYRGVTPPLFGMMMEKSIVFGVYQNTITVLNKNNNNYELLNRGISGAAAGFACSFVVTPVDRLKILYQTNQKSYRGNFNIFNLYRGFSNTLTREVPGFAIYFNVYESLKNLTKNDTNIYYHFMYGAVSGASAWAFIYPMDLIKTRVQATQGSNKVSFVDVIKNVYRQNGIRGFFRGFHLAVIRAIPLHAGTLSMFEYLNRRSLRDQN